MTAQFADRIIIDGERFKLFSNPLEDLWEGSERPLFSPGSINTALWRGYVATWQIENEQLFLVDIEGRMQIRHESGATPQIVKCALNHIFPDCDSSKVKADWYTGVLRIPLGLMVEYVHAGYQSKYERDWMIFVSSGIVIRRDLKSTPADFEF